MAKLNGYRMRLVLVGFVAAIVLGGGTAKADFTFGEPQDLGLGDGVVADGGSGYISVSADELELYFTSDRAGGLGYEDIWVSTRQSVHDPWGPPTNLQTVNSGRTRSVVLHTGQPQRPLERAG